MANWRAEVDKVYELAMKMAEKLRKIHLNHKLLKPLGSLKVHEAVINQFMDASTPWWTWPISRVLTVAYANYYLALREVVGWPQEPEPKVTPRDPILE